MGNRRALRQKISSANLSTEDGVSPPQSGAIHFQTRRKGETDMGDKGKKDKGKKEQQKKAQLNPKEKRKSKKEKKK